MHLSSLVLVTLNVTTVLGKLVSFTAYSCIRKGNCCSSSLWPCGSYSAWAIVTVLGLVNVDASKLARYFIHLKNVLTFESLATLRANDVHMNILVWLVAASLIWCRSSLWKEMSVSSHLRGRAWVSAIIIFTDIEHPFWLLVNYEVLILSKFIDSSFVGAVSLADWWDIAVWWLWTNALRILFAANTVILGVCSRYFFVSEHLELLIVILLLIDLKIFGSRCTELLGHLSANRVALIITRSLTIIAFLFNNKLVLLSSTLALMLLDLHCQLLVCDVTMSLYHIVNVRVVII